MIDTPQKYEKMIWAFLIGCFYLGWVAHSLGRTGYGRLEGVGPSDSQEVNALAAILITPIPILIFYIIEGKKYWQKITSLIFLAYIMDGVILTTSRGAFMGLVVSLLYFSYFIFFKHVKNFKFKMKMAFGLVLGLILFYHLTDVTFWERMTTLKHVEVGERGLVGAEGGAHRTPYWFKGLDLVKEYPLGVGGWG